MKKSVDIINYMCYIIVMNCKKEDTKRRKFIQATVCPVIHKRLRMLAAEQDITLAEAVQKVIEAYFDRRGGAK